MPQYGSYKIFPPLEVVVTQVLLHSPPSGVLFNKTHSPDSHCQSMSNYITTTSSMGHLVAILFETGRHFTAFIKTGSS